MFKKILARKLTKLYVGPCMIEEVMLINAVELRLLMSIRIHLVVNINRVVRYRKSVKKQRAKESKPVEIDRK